MSAAERPALVALKDARVRIPKIGGAGAIYERELLSVVDASADLIEADGKRLALAEKTIAAFRDWRVESDGYAGHPDHFDAILDSYDAAKEAGL